MAILDGRNLFRSGRHDTVLPRDIQDRETCNEECAMHTKWIAARDAKSERCQRRPFSFQ